MASQTQPAVTKSEMRGNSPQFGAQIPFDSLTEPGCYVSNWTGHLMRIPEDALKPGRSPVIEILGSEQLFVTKISDNPFVTLTKARMLAADSDVAVNF